MDTQTEGLRRATLAEGGEAAAEHAARSGDGAICAAVAEVMGARPGALKDLRRHWDDVYAIDLAGGRFRAERLDGRGGVEAATAQDLRDLMLADYAACPVPRRDREDLEEEE